MKKRLISAVFGAILALFSVVQFIPAQAATGRDCDPNAIIHCGALNKTELNDRVKGDVSNIYAHYGIQKAHFGSLVEGTVYRDGRISVGNKTVATNAISTGRHNMAGSTAVTAGGVRIYERPTSVSFRSNSIPAYVRMAGGKFQYAIIKSCGNPTKGTPTPEEPTPTPKISISKAVSKAVVDVNEEFTYTVRVRNTGPVDIQKAHVYDKAPAGVEFVPNSGTAGTTVTKTEFKTTIELLKKNEVKQFTFKAKFPNYVANPAMNEACVLAEKPQPVGACDKISNRPKKPPVTKEECLPGIPVGDERCETPEEPVEPEIPETPITPVTYTKELPSTGPAEVIGSAMGISSTTYGAVSYLRSRRGLKNLFR